MKMPHYGNTVFSTFLLILFIGFLTFRRCHGGRILVVPYDGSHWVNMELIIKELHSRGHSLDVVRSSRSWYIKEDTTYYKAVTVSVPEAIDQDFVNQILRRIFYIERSNSSALLTFASLQVDIFRAMFNMHRIMSSMATMMFTDNELMDVLKKRKYDLVLTDPTSGVGTMLAHALNLPLVYNVRWVTAREGHLTVAPSPLSYIPITGSGLSDKMSFMQRVKNLFFNILWQAQDEIACIRQYQAVCDAFFGPQVRFTDLEKGADLWLMRVDFVFEFPRPTMPNVVYMGGFQCKPAKPLPEHLEEFVQSSGEHGFIIMSLGTFVSGLPADMTSEIAAAFAKLPQKVIWRHKGERPATLGNNTLLVDWMPQNDLLGHPKIKLFVAHGGTNGVQEALYHGVPVVGLPLFFDQYDNLLRLKDRGAAKILTLSTVNENIFLKATEEVLNEPSYRMNMQRLSRLHRDQPMKPMDTATFWIEFVMRHKGAAHLKSQSYRLPWYTYHSVDVVLFLVAVVLLILGTFAALIRCICFKLCLQTKFKSD